MGAQSILIAIVAGIVYSVTMYAKKAQAGQTFDPLKFVSTVLVGILVALSIELSGAPLNELTWQQQFFMYAGLIPIVENLLKTVFRALTLRAERNVYRPRSGGLPKRK